MLTLRGHTQPVLSVTFSPDGERLASASGDMTTFADGEVKVWDARTGREILNLLHGREERLEPRDVHGPTRGAGRGRRRPRPRSRSGAAAATPRRGPLRRPTVSAP